MHRLPTRAGAGPLILIFFRIPFVERTSEFRDRLAIFLSTVKFRTFVRIASIPSSILPVLSRFLFGGATLTSCIRLPSTAVGRADRCATLRSRGTFAACMAPDSWAWGEQEPYLVHDTVDKLPFHRRYYWPDDIIVACSRWCLASERVAVLIF